MPVSQNLLPNSTNTDFYISCVEAQAWESCCHYSLKASRFHSSCLMPCGCLTVSIQDDLYTLGSVFHFMLSSSDLCLQRSSPGLWRIFCFHHCWLQLFFFFPCSWGCAPSTKQVAQTLYCNFQNWTESTEDSVQLTTVLVITPHCYSSQFMILLLNSRRIKNHKRPSLFSQHPNH